MRPPAKKKRKKVGFTIPALAFLIVERIQKKKVVLEGRASTFVRGVVTNCGEGGSALCDITKGTFSVPTFRKVLQRKEVKEAFTERKLANIIRILQ